MARNGIVVCIVALVITFGIVGNRLHTIATENTVARAEREHGIALPPSADQLQCKGTAWSHLPDRGASTMFEMASVDLPGFIRDLSIRSRSAPALSQGNPLISGFNVWPKTVKTAMPGNLKYGGFKATWEGDASPVEMLSCSSPTGDSLHVEYWKLDGDKLLVKMYTDWN